jgi:hypothetical protein
MASRKRMHHCKDFNEERGRKHDDEIAYKDKSHQLQLFRYACLYTERFCSIPLSSITTGRMSSPSRVSLMSSPQPRQSHQSPLKCLIIPIFLCSVIPWLSWNYRHYLGHESFPSLKRECRHWLSGLCLCKLLSNTTLIHPNRMHTNHTGRNQPTTIFILNPYKFLPYLNP